ncbi:MAG: VCBS repeat-containing protein [Thermoanaerobaculia bacterium]|nr:VCBS repeat-containing protein [Thermoanaerobaculia bacterium]
MRSTVRASLWLLVAALVPVRPAAADVPIQLLHGQLSPISAHHGVPYQDGPGVLLDSEAADDFIVPADQVWALTEVKVRGFTLPSGDGIPDDVDVAIYADGGGKPGVLICDYPLVKPAPLDFDASSGAHTLSLNLPHPCTLCAGTHYWVALQAVDATGSYFWRQRTAQHASPAQWRNPAGGYGAGCTDWRSAAAGCGQGDGVSPDLSFALYGRPLTPGHVKGDFNGDLCTDVVFQEEASSNAKVWNMSGSSRLSETALCPTPDLNWKIAGADDFNGDGRADVVFRHVTTGDVAFRFTGVPCDQDPVPLTTTNRPATDLRLEATGDMNGDAHPDLVFRNVLTDKIVIWALNGTTVAGTPLTTSPDGTTTPSNWEIEAAMDFSGDALPDLLWRNRDSGKLVMWFLDAGLVRTSGDFTVPQQPATGGIEWKVLGAGDYGIGRKDTPTGPEPVCTSNDLLWQNDFSAKTVIWYFNFNRERTGGEYTFPDGPGLTPRWNVVGPR